MTSQQLYTGPDVENAAAKSSLAALPWQQRVSPRPRLPLAIDSLVVDALNTPAIRFFPAAALATGTECTSGTTMRILFQGQLRSVEFCAEHILGTTDFEIVPLSSPTDRHYDAVVTDHPLLDRGLFGRKPALSIPQWVRQRCSLGDSWQQTVANIQVPLRKRVARSLGKHRFTVHLRPAALAANDFYHALYLPYLKRRFGSAAIVTSERAFMREAHDGLLLELRLDRQLLGASLVRAHGDTLYLGKSALSLHQAISHVFDLLDYFCFLLAQLAGCRHLDFGVSRPHIEDGTFVNKTKWRPQLIPAGRLKPTIRIRLANRSPATWGFLARNGFIERRADAFIVQRLYGEHVPSTEEATELRRLAARSGLDALIIACATDDPPQAFAGVASPPHIQRLIRSGESLPSLLSRI